MTFNTCGACPILLPTSPLFRPGPVQVTNDNPGILGIPSEDRGKFLPPGIYPIARLANIQQDGLGDNQQDGLANTRQDGLADRTPALSPARPQQTQDCFASSSEGPFTHPAPSTPTCSPARPNTTPPTPAFSLARPHQTQPKYYSVTVGRRCGVFTGWTYVHSLVNRVPGSACFGFNSREEALEDYHTMKTHGHVHVSGRVEGDEQEFGPMSDAIM
ncbi:uncharacterized protein LACBIDRAFT_308190 [Laccaria bicolor S238N-H82]|uniref:Predicted protein n=1 Tax=Laccaria bicolor (strain S238N-H82 / ATCC MYA-4686) TaxID=486041 RepID=B0DRT1_LACBS|nr:uncharacterized protein LACBIDRAFT_308190 [Laccaria bicolor S238N-H82]EDR02663.1 predicted protein [Laccaria bicolor S238N-H82]|eukprot:XP_001886707.1 predicted protein [Laccaria bicolor S238N-H82]